LSAIEKSESRMNRSRDCRANYKKFDFDSIQEATLILLLGVSGVGKTSFISEAIEEDLQVGQRLESGQCLFCFFTQTAAPRA
jgi:predicted AAA+ superfamily ATPase